MVGVAGRSRACDNCRRRRIKCDLAAPACSRCVKARLSCGGSQDLAFIQYNGESSTASIRPEPAGHLVIKANATELHSRRDLAQTGSRLSVSKQMPISYDEVFLAYTRSHLIREHEDVWFDHPRPSQSSLTERCVLALSTTYFGVDHVEQPITRLGLTRYGQVLSELNRELGSPRARHSSDLLFAVVLMTMFECVNLKFLIGDKDSGWIKHARGLEELLRIQGPGAMTSLGHLIILEGARPSLIFAAIFSRQRTILAHDEWKTIPWTAHPDRNDATKLLIDILADCPEVFALRNDILAALHDNHGRHSAPVHLFKTKALRILDELKSWKELFPALLNQWTEIPAPVDAPSFAGHRRLSWDSVFHFESLHHANLTSLYHSIFILVAQLIQNLDHDNGYIELEGDVYAAALTICRSIDYHLESVRVGADSLFILFPMRMAYDAVGEKHPEIGGWIKNKIDGISTQSSGRWATARYLLDMRSSATILDSSLGSAR